MPRGFDIPREQREAGEEAEQDRLAKLGEWQGECIHTPGLDCYSGQCCRRPSLEKV